MANIELPKVLYDENGNEYEVHPQRKWEVVMMDCIAHNVSDLYLTPPDPDSWEKLLGVRSKMIDVECPNCGRQVDPHSGHIPGGRVFVCEKGKPLMREIKYYCENCHSTIIFLKKYEPEGVGNDR